MPGKLVHLSGNSKVFHQTMKIGTWPSGKAPTFGVGDRRFESFCSNKIDMFR